MLDPEIDRVEQNDRSTAICARLDDQLDFRQIFQLGSTWLNSCQMWSTWSTWPLVRYTEDEGE